MMGLLGNHRSLWGQSPPLQGHSQLLCCHTEDDEQVQEPESLWGQGWHREGSGEALQQSTPSTALSRPYIEGDSQGQQPGREDTEDPIEVVEEAPVQLAVGVAPDELAPLGAVVLPNLPALRGRGENAWPGTTEHPLSLHGLLWAPRGDPVHPEGTLPTPRGHCPPQHCHGTGFGRSLSPLPQFPHLRPCQSQQKGTPLFPAHPCPHPAHTHRGPWETARLAEEKTTREEIPERRDGTPPPRQHPAPSRRPPRAQRSPQTHIQAPSVAQSILPGGERVPPVQQQRGPGQAEHPGQPRGALPHVPWRGQPRGHLPAAGLPGHRERGLPPEPHPALPGRGEEGVKISNKIGMYN